MFLDALIEVSARIPDIVCIAQTTLVMVNNALLVYDRRLLFFRFDTDQNDLREIETSFFIASFYSEMCFKKTTYKNKLIILNNQ